jgi:predicted TIM-barrel fold metal-dependent hydrolase
MPGFAIPVFDAHLHIIDGRFPLIPNHGYLPDEFSCREYLNRMAGYPAKGGVVVSGSFQGYDQDYLIDALKQLGASFVGVTQLPHSVSDNEILDLDALGVRAVRFNLKRGGSEDVRDLERMARRIHEIAGWHVELYVDSGALGDLYGILKALPAVSIDHLGLSKKGFGTLLKLVEQGVHVKATGFGRVDFDVRRALRDLYSANPESLMFGTDLPSTRAPRPYEDQDMDLIVDTLGVERARKVLSDNAMKLYRPNDLGQKSGSGEFATTARSAGV